MKFTNKFSLFIMTAIVFVYSANGQNCTCESNFEWVKTTFEENDAGFQYAIDKKGQVAYNIHNQQIVEKIKVAKTLTECASLLYEWQKFFRSGHIGIGLLTNETTDSQNVSQTITENSKHDTWRGNISHFEQHISTKEEADYEGIWNIDDTYKVGIIKEGENFIGFIIESEIDIWKQKMVKLKILKDGDKWKSTFYMRDYSAVESDAVELIGKNYLQIGQIMLNRQSPIFPQDPFVENYFKSMKSRSPFVEELNSTTLYLRIPSFELENKSAIDKVLADNKDKILKTENLIIDLRNNGGGSDQSFEELIPFLYTNPIRTISVEFLSTTLNNQQFLNYSTNPDFDKDMQKWTKNVYDKLQEKLGEFVFPFNVPVSINQQETIYDYPKNVGIIINEGNASTTEQFLLAAKQSKKVKLFGTSTSGCLDISNMNSVESPCQEFQLWYCMSRSLRIPDMTIDEFGLQPDYYLDKTISQYKWVEFVNDILNQ